MSEVVQAAEQQQEEVVLTKEQVVEQINGFRTGIINAAIDNKLSFDVIFNALAQAVSMFIFDFQLSTKGELGDEGVAKSVAQFNAQLESVSKVGLENMRAQVKAQQEAEAEAQDTPFRIITEA